MARVGSLPEALVRAVADGRAVLFLGAGFSHGVTELDWPALIERLRPQVTDTSGWDTLDALDRAQLFVVANGRDCLEAELAGLLPTAEVLGDKVTDFHREVLKMPFPIIVTTNYDGLVEATLNDLGETYRLIVDEDEVVDAFAREDDCRLVIKMHGDLWLGDTIVLTREDYLTYEHRRPKMVALLHSLLLSRTFFFFGFGLSDPNFLLLFHKVLQQGVRSRSAYAVMREPNSLLVKYWAGHRVEIVSGNTFGDLEHIVLALGRESESRRRAEWDLETVLDAHFPEERDGVLRAFGEVRDRFARQLEKLEPFLWVRFTDRQLEAYTATEGDDILGSFRVLLAFERANLPIDPQVFAMTAELLVKFNELHEARAAVDACLRAIRRPPRIVTPRLRASVGRVLCRLGELDRARPFLERALVDGDKADQAGRTAELAWLSKCILDRAERLRERRRERAARELLGRFLGTYASYFSLATLTPPTRTPGARDDVDDAIRWSLYYVNLRLGRLFALAAELAGQSGQVYATQAVAYLTRTANLAPSKPEAYRALKPLLCHARATAAQRTAWLQILSKAPPELQRKLAASGTGTTDEG